MSILAVLAAYMLLNVLKVSGSGVFELHLKSLSNKGLNSDGNCCSGVRTGGECTSTCRTFFRVCLNHFQTVISENPSCTFGSITTEVLGENSFQLPSSQNAFTNPIRLPFDFYWPGTFTLIIEAWHDTTLEGPTPGSPRELVLREKVSRSVQVGENWSHFSYNPPHHMQLDYKYRVICDEDYYGAGCGAVCRPREDGFGHYKCTSNGTLACLAGWNGRYCDKAICLRGCHPSNGSCENPNECHCRPGWRGTLCDECVPYPGCQHGTCSQPFECKCNEGWGGLFCNLDLNYCTNNAPCKNGATCTNTGRGSYTCSCTPGTTGTNCEVQVDDCKNKPCMNGGTCKVVGNNYQCECPAGFHGRHCNSSAKSCDENPCKNDGSCISYVNTYRCMCLPGFTGVNCDSDVDECASNPCRNDGRCVNERNGFRCVCQTGYSGAICEQNNIDCSNSTCMNGGTCRDLVNDFVCACIPGFIGVVCQTNINDCANKPCGNNGVCQDLVNDFRCFCPTGFSGKQCQQNINECQAEPCMNGASCTDLTNDYMCTCPPGYNGKSCEYPPGVLLHSSSTPKSDRTGTKSPPISGQPTSSEPGNSGVSGAMSQEDNSVETMQQVLLIVCLGVGIPIMIIIIIIIVLLCHCKRTQEDATNVRKDNEQNEFSSMNNQLKCIDSTMIQNQIPTTNIKLTNEEYDSSRTFQQAKQQLNLDKCTNDKSSHKAFLKDLNTKTKTQYNVHNTPDILHNKCNRTDDGTLHKSLDRDPSSIESTSVDISALHTAADIHHVQKTFSSEPNSILYFDKQQQRHQPTYNEGILATEV